MSEELPEWVVEVVVERRYTARLRSISGPDACVAVGDLIRAGDDNGLIPNDPPGSIISDIRARRVQVAKVES